MKKKEIEKLVNLTDQKDLNPADFTVFSEPVKAKQYFSLLSLARRRKPDTEPDFSPYFVEKVMGRLNRVVQSPGLDDYLSMLLSKVMTYGLTALALVFLTLYFLHGQDGIGTVIGSDTTNDMNFISYLFYEF